MTEPNNPANDDRASPSPSLMVASIGRHQPSYTRSVPTNHAIEVVNATNDGDVVVKPSPVMVTTNPVDWNSFFDCLIAVMLHTMDRTKDKPPMPIIT